MSIHIAAKQGEIADIVLLPGDPLRAKFIAETFLEDVTCYNEVRGMYGFTGTYKGRRISVQGTGMGMPSTAIYVTGLMQEYGVQKLIRVGTCGALQEDVKLRDVILVQSTTTESGMNKVIWGGGIDFAPTANFDLLYKAYNAGKEAGLELKVGSVLTADAFYHSEEHQYEKLAKYGILAVEMESAALFTLAAKFGRQALTVLTVSDHVVTGESASSEERQTTFLDMMKVALEAAIAE